ncbi:hypothetical protein [Acetobacterium sp.]|uniref:hypothetical protein n=1 Tax=Acetobacterium sp. TaxID=1872094 RepID=UPI002F40E01E
MIIIIPLCILIGLLAWRLRPHKHETRSSRIAIFATILPSAVMAIAAVAFQLRYNASGVISVAEASNSIFVAGLIFIGVGILVSICFALFRKKDITKSIGFGLCISFFITVVELGLLEWLGGV